MKKEKLLQKIKTLLAKNKTAEALTELSKIQLSENDKTVILLMAQLTKLQQDSMLNKLSNDEKDRRQTKINEAIFELSENIDINEVKLKDKASGLIETLSIGKSLKQITAVPDLDLIKKTVQHEGSEKKKPYWLLFLLIPLMFLILKDKLRSPENANTSSSKKENRFLQNPEAVWELSDAIYFENFAEQKKAGFRSDIWNSKKGKGYHMRPDESGAWYQISIQNSDFFSRHKYLGKMGYDANRDILPYSVKIYIDGQSNCISDHQCLGRGLTIRYDNKKNSAYSYTINDSGEIQFNRMNNFNDPRSGSVLFSQKRVIERGAFYELGLVCIDQKFLLFVDKELLTIVIDDQPMLNGRYNGIIAIGRGEHIFDDVSLGQVRN